MKRRAGIFGVLLTALFLFNSPAQSDENERQPELWAEKISVSGLLEVEGSYENLDPDVGSDEEQSDILLATVELAINAALVKHVTSHIHLLYEEDETPFEVDEGGDHH